VFFELVEIFSWPIWLCFGWVCVDVGRIRPSVGCMFESDWSCYMVVVWFRVLERVSIVMDFVIVMLGFDMLCVTQNEFCGVFLKRGSIDDLFVLVCWNILCWNLFCFGCCMPCAVSGIFLGFHEIVLLGSSASIIRGTYTVEIGTLLGLRWLEMTSVEHTFFRTKNAR